MNIIHNGFLKSSLAAQMTIKQGLKQIYLLHLLSVSCLCFMEGLCYNEAFKEELETPNSFQCRELQVRPKVSVCHARKLSGCYEFCSSESSVGLLLSLDDTFLKE